MRNLRTLPRFRRSLFVEVLVLALQVHLALKRLPFAYGPLFSWEPLLVLAMKIVLVKRC